MIELKKGVERLIRKISRINPIVILLLVVISVSVYLFVRFELAADDNKWFNALYWIITTATTVGYGDMVPVTFEGRVVAMVVMIFGVSLLGFILSTITHRIISANLKDVLGISRTKRKVDYIICGWNELSLATFEQINTGKEHIIIIDEAVNPGILEGDVKYLKGNPKDAIILEKANIRNAKNVILCMANDSDVLLTIHLVRHLNPWVTIVAKINDYEHVKLAEHAGADQVVSPSSLTGRLLSIATEEPYVVKWVLNATTSSGEEEFVEHNITALSPFAGKRIDDVRESMKNAKIIGLVTHSGVDKFPSNDYVINTGDKLVLMGKVENVHR